jgi:Zn finger protein HypA/HybF involved in hydrogenase expression
MPVYKTYSCIHCVTTVTKANSKEKFCSIQCQQDYTLNENVKNGVASPKTLKRFLIKEHGNKCWVCGITEWNDKPIVMELEHNDGNSQNNSLDNLSLICPNCHSQTPTYKGSNKGNGRYYRRVRYAQGKSY